MDVIHHRRLCSMRTMDIGSHMENKHRATAFYFWSVESWIIKMKSTTNSAQTSNTAVSLSPIFFPAIIFFSFRLSTSLKIREYSHVLRRSSPWWFDWSLCWRQSQIAEGAAGFSAFKPERSRWRWSNSFVHCLWWANFRCFLLRLTINLTPNTFLITGVGSVECVKLLVEFGAKVNARDGDGICPLYMAAQEGREEIVKVSLNIEIYILTFWTNFCHELVNRMVPFFASTSFFAISDFVGLRGYRSWFCWWLSHYAAHHRHPISTRENCQDVDRCWSKCKSRRYWWCKYNK